MAEIKNNQRIIAFDVLRIIAAFAVVWLHTSAQRFEDCFPSNEWMVMNVYDSMVRWSVPVFIMISGAIFLDPSRNVDMKKLYTKNVTRIILIFFFWSIVYAIYEGIGEDGIAGFVSDIIKGPYHFWFLRMLIGLYIVVPILRMIVTDKKIGLYFIILAIVTAFCIPMLFPVISRFHADTGEFFKNYYNSFEIKIATGYVGYFVLGYYLSTNDLRHFQKYMFYFLGVVSVIIVSILTFFVSKEANAPSEEYYNYLNIFTFLEATALFVFVKEIKIPTKYHPLLIKVSKMTLGIYIIHILVLEIADDIFGINTTTFDPLFSIPCFSCLIFVISCGIVLFLYKIPFLRKMVI